MMADIEAAVDREVCLDQVDFMSRLMEPARFHERIKRWAEEADRENGLGGHAVKVLEALLYRGE